MSHNDGRWPPMESNPDVMNQMAQLLGLNTHQFSFVDVFGLDDELLQFVPQPVIALILLFPSTAKVKYDDSKRGTQDVFFLKQLKQLDDACGTIAMIHALTNNKEVLGISDDSIISRYIQSCRVGSSMERGTSLLNNSEISGLHVRFSNEGQTESIRESGVSNHHFVCFIPVNNHVYELDGCKPNPIDHGEIHESFLKSAAVIIQTVYMSNPDVVDFSIISLSGRND